MRRALGAVASVIALSTSCVSGAVRLLDCRGVRVEGNTIDAASADGTSSDIRASGNLLLGP